MPESSVIGLLRVILTADTAEFETGMRAAATAADKWSKDVKKIGAQATAVGSALTKALTIPIAGIAGASVKAAVDFESSFAGVAKTVDGVVTKGGELTAFGTQLAQTMRDLAKEIPINVNELNRLAEAGGAMGIPKDALAEFSKTMALLGVTTNLTADQAAESIGKIQNVFQSAGKDTDRFASTLVALGNEGASTESQILDMATRIAGAGKTVGLTQGEVLGFANALSSVGLEAEAGGTAISRVFVDMAAAVSEGGKDLQQFAEVAAQSTEMAGISAEGFAKAFKEDAAGAVQAFIAGLGNIKASGGDVLAILKDMGIKEVRLRDTLLLAANAGDLLKKSLDLQAKAWNENAALTEEARKRFETTEAQLTILWNRVKDVGITIGNALLPAIKSAIGLFDSLLPIVSGAANAFAALPGPIQGIVIAVAGLAAAIGPLVLVFGQLATGSTAIAAAFGKQGIATKLITGLMGGFGTSTATAAGSTGILATALSALPWVAVIAGLTAVGVAVYKVATAETDLEKSLRTNTEGFKSQTDALAQSIDVYTSLSAKQNLTANETKQLDTATRALAKASGLSKEAFEDENRSSGTLTNALREQVRARKELYAAAVDQARSAAAEVGVQLREAQDRLAEVLAGRAKTLKPVGPGGAMVPAEMTAGERVQEVERLNAKIAELGKSADEANKKFVTMAGAKPFQSIEIGAATAKEQLEKLRAAVNALTTDQKTEIDAALKLGQTYEQAAKSAGTTAEIVKAYAQGLGQASAAAKGTGDSLAALKGQIDKLREDPEVFASFAEKVDSGAYSLKQLSAEFGVSQGAIKLYKGELKDAETAHKAAGKAAAAQQKDLEQLDAAMEKVGLVTVTGFSRKLGEMVEVLNLAAEQGGPALLAAVKALEPEFRELDEAARKAGIGIGIAGQVLDEFAEKAGLATLKTRNLGQTLITLAPDVQSNVNLTREQSAELSQQAKAAAELEAAYKRFGLNTRAELEATARQAEQDYALIVAAVGRHAPEAEAAYKKMIEAQRAATGQLPSTWETEVLPRIKNAVKAIGDAVSTNLSAMLLHAQGFKEGFLNIWDNIKRSIIDIFASILEQFINSFLKGMLNAILGQQGAFTKAFGGLFGGATDILSDSGGIGGQGGGLLGKLLGKIPGLGGLLGGATAVAGPVGTVTAGLPSVAGVGVTVPVGGAPGVAAAGTGIGAAGAGLLAGGAGFGLGVLGNKLFDSKAAGAAFGGATGAAAGAAIAAALAPATLGLSLVVGGLTGVLGGLINFGPSKEERAARDVTRSFKEQTFAGLSDTQRTEAMNAGWTDPKAAGLLIAVRDAYVSVGKSAADAEKDVKAMWDAEVNGPEATQAAMQPILAAMEEYRKTSTGAEQAHQAEIEKTTADLAKKRDAIREQIGALDKELADIGAKEAPEAHMGTIEKRARERIAAQKAALEAQLADLSTAGRDAFQTMGEAANAAGSHLTGFADKIADLKKQLAPDEARALAEGYQEAINEGFKGSQDQFLAQQLQYYQTLEEGDARVKTFFYGSTIDAFKNIAAEAGISLGDVSAALDAMGMHGATASATLAQSLGGLPMQALSDLANGLRTEIPAGATAGIQAAQQAFQALPAAVQPAVATWATSLRDALASGSAEGVAAVLANANQLPAAVQPAIAQIVAAFGTGGKDAADALDLGLGQAVPMTEERAKAIREAMNRGCFGPIDGDVSDLIKNIGDKFGTLPDEAGEAGDGIVNQFRDAVVDSERQFERLDIDPIHVRFKYDLPDLPDFPDLPGHALGGVFSRPHVAQIAEGGEAEIVGSVGFMTRALEGALGRVGSVAGSGAAKVFVVPIVGTPSESDVDRMIETLVRAEPRIAGNSGGVRTAIRSAVGIR